MTLVLVAATSLTLSKVVSNHLRRKKCEVSREIYAHRTGNLDPWHINCVAGCSMLAVVTGISLVCLRAGRAASVDNCDIQTSIPGAFLCDLSAIPKPSGSYDAILCNAVLEHVPDPEKVMAEFPPSPDTGRLFGCVGAIPATISSYSPSISVDIPAPAWSNWGNGRAFRLSRCTLYTAWLRPSAGFSGLIWRSGVAASVSLLCWLPIYLASRLSQHPPAGQTYTANSFQAVLVKI